MPSKSEGTDDDSNFNVKLGDHQLFDPMNSSVKPQIKLEVLTARQVNRAIMFNVIAWLLAVFVAIGRAVVNNTLRRSLKQVKMPNGKVKTLLWVKGNHWGCWAQYIPSVFLCLVAIALAIVFSIRLFRSRKKYKITVGQKMALAMIISLAVSMQPFIIIFMMHDICWLETDPMHPKPGEWNSMRWAELLTRISTIWRMLFVSASSILYTWGVSHILGNPELMATKRGRITFLVQKLVPLFFYDLLRLYCLIAEKAIPTYLPFSSFIGMVQNFYTMGIWYPRVVIIISIITVMEAAFIVAIALRMRSTAKALRASNYIETRVRQVSFRFLIWTTILPLAIFYLYQLIDRNTAPIYIKIALWLRDPTRRNGVHYFNTNSWLERDILLVSQAVVIAYAHLPVDSGGFVGWFKSARKGPANSQDRCSEAQPISLTPLEDKSGDDGPNSLCTFRSASQCVLPSHILSFNFSWLAYTFEKANHGGKVLANAGFNIKCHIKHEETDTFLLIANYLDRIIVSFKGTTSMKNVATDLKVVTVPLLSAFPTCGSAREKLREKREWRNAKIHKGFIAAYSAVSERVMHELRELLDDGPKPIFCTGHSLGGALATLCSLDICTSLSVSPDNVVVSTFGSPRCGNSSWRAVYDHNVKAHWRFAIEDDIVTMLPRSFTYDHVGKQVLLKAGGNMLLDPSGIEDSLFGAKGPSLKSHKKSAYMMYIDDFCKKNLFNFEPMFWKAANVEDENVANEKSNVRTGKVECIES